MKKWFSFLTVISMIFIALPSVGDNLEFTGNLLAQPACTVSDKGGRIDVHFQSNIAVNRIDGERYRQAVAYQIECPEASRTGSKWNLRLTLIGVNAHFDSAALKTSVDDLGIKITLGGATLVPNQSREIDVNATTPPVMEAVPVKRVGAELPSTDFTASALLMAELY